MEHYPFTKCLKPRRIINPYTHESLVVECGSCPACSLRKASMSALKVQLESLSHKYSMFITLTYNNISLPRMQLRAVNRYIDSESGDIVDTNEQFNLIDITQRLGTQGLVLGRTPDFYMCYETLSKKTELPRKILPHLSKYDAQLFLKRLRRNLDKYYLAKYGTNAPQIRYYLVGEYGPIHFRPHYHVILWFSDDETYKVIRQILFKSWPFGRIDCQKSLGKCADYVAKYLNSNMSLPDVFKFQRTRPFAIHSTHLGEKVLAMPREKIYSDEFESVVKHSIPCSFGISEVLLWRSLKTFYFPKCKGYSTKSEQERLYTYKTYVNAYRWTGTTKIVEQTRAIVNTILCRFYHVDLADDMYYYPDDLLDYFEKSSMFNPWNYEGKTFEEHIDDVFRRIYMELRLAKHFHRYVCKGFLNLYQPMLQKIDSFWKSNDMYNLKQQLNYEKEFVESDWFNDISELDYFHHNLGFHIDKFKQTKVYRCYESVVLKNSENAVKHKKLNDENRKLLY